MFIHIHVPSFKSTIFQSITATNLYKKSLKIPKKGIRSRKSKKTDNSNG